MVIRVDVVLLLIWLILGVVILLLNLYVELLLGGHLVCLYDGLLLNRVLNGLNMLAVVLWLFDLLESIGWLHVLVNLLYHYMLSFISGYHLLVHHRVHLLNLLEANDVLRVKVCVIH